MNDKALSPEEYISLLPEERKEAMEKLRAVFTKFMPKGFEEIMSYGMISYSVPHSIYPAGYHCDTSIPLPFISIASQKNFIAIYHMGIYAIPELLEWFTSEYPKHVKTKIDMGKSCIRFKKIELIPYELLTELAKKITVEEWIKIYEAELKN